MMALLTRFIKLNDEEDSHVFTFLVTKSVTKSTISKDVVSKDFGYGFHRWAVAFSKENKVWKKSKPYYLMTLVVLDSISFYSW